MIRLAFQGVSNQAIAAQVGCSPASVSAVLRSPIAKAELARMAAKAEDKLTDIPAKVRLMNEMQGMAVDAFRLRRQWMNNDALDIKVRARISEHVLDRVVFNENDDTRGGSIRDILRRLDDVRDAIKDGKIQKAPDIIEVTQQGSEEAMA